MKVLRFSGGCASPTPETCSAETIVPWITSRSTPADEDRRRVAHRVLRRDAHRGDRAGVADLLDPLRDQLVAHRLGVDPLQRRRSRPPGRARTAPRAPAAGRRTGSTALRRRARRDRRPRPTAPTVAGDIVASDGNADQRQVEPIGVDLPGQRDDVDVTGTPRRHDRDVVEGEATPSRPAEADLDAVSHHRPASSRRVVRCLGRHRDVVRVALLQTRPP